MAASFTVMRYNSPCAACKFLRRKCIPDCFFAPYFPPEEPHKFTLVHKIFGASNVSKLLNEVLPHQREDVVSSLAYEAEARVRDPVFGCAGVISSLQWQVERLQTELDTANAELINNACGCNHCYHYRHQNVITTPAAMPIYPNYADQVPETIRPGVELINTGGSGISYYQTSSTFSFPSGQGGAAEQGL
ncbi:hypothetical protein AgCh_011409 [Apium graveolens]